MVSLLTVLGTLGTATPLHAQQRDDRDDQQGIGIGIKGGPLFASLDEEGGLDTKTRSGFAAGLFLGGNRPGVVGVGVDLLYARKGAKDPDSDITLDMDYLNVPVYVRINGGSSSRGGVSGYGIAGVDLNFLLEADFSVGGDSVTDQFSRADYGIVVGAGVEVSRFIVEGRYTKGLGNIAKDKSDPDLKSQSFAILFGVRLN